MQGICIGVDSGIIRSTSSLSQLRPTQLDRLSCYHPGVGAGTAPPTSGATPQAADQIGAPWSKLTTIMFALRAHHDELVHELD